MDVDAIKIDLLSRRGALLTRIKRLHSDVHFRDEPFSQDFAEQATEVENLEVLQEIDESSRKELALINKALARIDEGTYQNCSACGQLINEARLQALPYSVTCISCADSE